MKQYYIIGLTMLMALLISATALPTDAASAPSSTFIVTSLADGADANINGTCATSGAVCTLRAALQEANDTSAADTIQFNISGTGPHEIRPNSPLPIITAPITIDGDSQPGAGCSNVLNPANLKIVLDGRNAGIESDAHGLTLDSGADNSLIRGLVIINFERDGINLTDVDDLQIECNHIGISADGVTPGDNAYGIYIGGNSSNITIGGTTNNARTERNILSGNRFAGVWVGINTNGGDISGNFIGTNALGINAVGNGRDGISLWGDNYVIGGVQPQHANVISGNGFDGLSIVRTSSNISVDNNRIGVNVFGSGTLGNGYAGISVNGTGFGSGANNIAIGLSAPNIIANNVEQGVLIADNGYSLNEIAIRFNKIYDNGELGIDLRGDGVTPNDPLDIDFVGANDLQNYPTITRADNTTAQGSQIDKVTVEGTLFSHVSSSFDLDFYYVDDCDPGGYGEGEVYVGSTSVNTNSVQGSATFAIDFTNVGSPDVVPPVDSYLTATATDDDGNTSEFSQCKIVTDESTLTVNSDDDNDDGDCDSNHCSLREAINASNQISPPETGTLLFDMNSNYVKIGSPLPAITRPIRIAGLSQPGDDPAACPANATTPAVINVHIDYVGSVSADGLHLASGSDNSQISGLAITNFTGDGIQIDSNATLIYCNHIGVEPDGMTAGGNGASGINVAAGEYNIIGGDRGTLRNVIAANTLNGVHLSSGNGRFTTVVGNIIGLMADGESDLGNNRDGVRIDGSQFNTIGGSSVGAGNVISGNRLNGAYVNNTSQFGAFVGNYIGLGIDGDSAAGNGTNGIHISGGFLNSVGGLTEGAGNVIGSNGGTGILLNGNASLVTIEGNIIGRNASNTAARGNLSDGIIINSAGSGDNVIASNTIASNVGDGVRLVLGSDNTITQNSMFDNGGLGIDLGNNGVQANDGGDGDGGANGLLNFPELLISADNLTIVGTFNSSPNSDYTLEFFHSTSCDPSDHGEGERYIGSRSVTLPASGIFQFTAALLYPDVPVGDYVTATATDADGNTSEFSACIEVIDAYIVNTVGDLVREIGDGQCNSTSGSALGGTTCTLRNAITELNALNAPSKPIYFAIEGSGQHIIEPDSKLPSVGETAIIDALTYQDSATCQSQRVRIDGSNQPTSAPNGLRFNVNSAGSSLSGLELVNFHGAAIVSEREDITYDCLRLGERISSVIDNPNGIGIQIFAAGNVIRDSIITHNSGDGVYAETGTASANLTTISNSLINNNDGQGIHLNSSKSVVIENNDITNNGEQGVYVVDSNLITVGGSLLDNKGNNIYLNGGHGIDVLGNSSNIRIFGNDIGVASPSLNVGNDGHGINFESVGHATVGGAGLENRIWFNEGAGVRVKLLTGGYTSDKAIRENSFNFNDRLAVDFGFDDNVIGGGGLTIPVVVSSDSNGSVVVRAQSLPEGEYEVFVYNSTTCDSSGNGEGLQFIGTLSFEIAGSTSREVTVASSMQVADSVTTALIVSSDLNSSSEFSACKTVVQGVPTAVAVSVQHVGADGQRVGVVLVGLILVVGSVWVSFGRKSPTQTTPTA